MKTFKCECDWYSVHCSMAAEGEIEKEKDREDSSQRRKNEKSPSMTTALGQCPSDSARPWVSVCVRLCVCCVRLCLHACESVHTEKEKQCVF